MGMVVAKSSVQRRRGHTEGTRKPIEGNQILVHPWGTLLLATLIFLSSAPSVLSANPNPERVRKVLLVHSFEPFLPYSVIVNQSVQKTLLSKKGERFEFFSEYLDLARFPGASHHQKLVELLKERYGSAPPDLVIAVLVPALDFVLKYKMDLFGNAPVVFCGIEPSQAEVMKIDGHVTGILMELDPEATLEAALRLQPDTERVVVVGGTSKNDRVFNNPVLRACEKQGGKVQFTFLIGKPIEAIYGDVRRLPPKTIVFYVTMFQDGEGKAQIPAVVAGRLSEAASVPVYSLFDAYLGTGIVGGRLVSFGMQGKAAAETGYRIMKGERPEAIPYAPSPNVYKFDWRQLKKWKLSEARLPPQSTVEFRELSLWGLYKWWVVGAIGFSIVEGFLIILLLVHRARWRKAEEALRGEKERFLTVAENAPFGLMLLDKNDAITYNNPTFKTLTGYGVDDVPTAASWFSKAFSDETVRTRLTERWKAYREESFPVEKSTACETVSCKDGSQKVINFIAVPLKTGGIVVTAEDITDRRRLESQLRQAQKMEAVGTLAGGIAHDFNNILSVITGFASLLKMGIPLADQERNYVDQILSAADRAATLTGSLLAFSRKQMIDPKPVDLNVVIENARTILSRLIGEDIEMATVHSASSPVALVDEVQLDQILINLATNARDAMPKGGSLVISAGMAEIDEEFIASHKYGKIGFYATLSVSDTGEGMDERTKERIFEPFFTTKEIGRGTGLGLAIVYGIVKQHDGYIHVESASKEGTTFTVFLPLAESIRHSPEPALPETIPGGSETILISEDEETLREFLETLLTSTGYQVISASEGEDAVRQFSENKHLIDLVLLDVVMPKMNGGEVYEEIRKMRNDVPVIFCSGYTFDMVHQKGIREEGVEFIQKPLMPDVLLRKIRAVLDNSKANHL
jgi:PAS domain S-box-containing protein